MKKIEIKPIGLTAKELWNKRIALMNPKEKGYTKIQRLALIDLGITQKSITPQEAKKQIKEEKK